MRSFIFLCACLLSFQASALTFKSGQSVSGGTQKATISQDEIDACASRDLTPDAAKTLSVMSFNIRYDNAGDGANAWPNRTDKVASIFTKYDVSLGGLQEVLHHQTEWLQANMTDYEFVGVGRDDGKTKGEYAPIFYKKSEFEMLNYDTIWLSETPDVPGSKGWDAALPRIATMALLRHKSSGTSLLLGSAHYDHKGTQAKRNSGLVIHDYITKALASHDIPLILLTGDFNDTPNTSTTGAIERTNCLFDSRRLTDVREGPNSTWNGFRSVAAFERIDYIFMNPALPVVSQVIDAERIDGGFPSDHMPVITTIKAPQ